MSFYNTSEDLRSIKTKKALCASMLTLLKKHNFRKITIKGICEEALISRAAFYAHFIDKYDLLKYWITELLPKDSNGNDIYRQIEKIVNYNIHENMIILKNLFNDADNETFKILFDLILSTININIEENQRKEINPKDIVLSNFYAGGIISYLFWQVQNKFPADVPLMNRYFYEISNILKDWQSQ